MKKILSILLIALILVSAVSVTAFADSVQYKYGSTILTDINTVYEEYISSHPYVVITRYDNKYYLYASASKFYVGYTSSYYIKSNGQTYKWTYTDGQWENRTTIDFTYNTINFSNEPLIWSNTDLIYSGNVYYTASVPLPLFCDGSSCPASDVDRDGVCDDCGLSLVFNLRGDTISLNNASFARNIMLADGSIVDFYTHFDNIALNSNLVIISSSGEFDNATLYQLSPNVQVLNGFATTVDTTSVGVFTSEYDSNGAPYWKYNASANWSSGQRLGTSGSVWWTAKEIPAGDSLSQSIEGDPNFILPLWRTILGLTQGEMTIQQMTIIRTMGILALCGIGCLALLIVLILLRKKSLLFLKN